MLRPSTRGSASTPPAWTPRSGPGARSSGRRRAIETWRLVVGRLLRRADRVRVLVDLRAPRRFRSAHDRFGGERRARGARVTAHGAVGVVAAAAVRAFAR